MKKIFVILLVLILQFGSSPAIILAQEATLSAQEATPSAVPDNLENLNNLEATSLALNISEALPSAQIKFPPSVRTLSKKNYKAGEKLTVVIDNVEASDYQISLFGPDGRETDITVEEVNDSYPAIFRIIPPAQFKAGRHRLVVKDSTENVLSTQEFTWGVLAINTNKSIYLPNETAKLAMAVLDETGLMVCDALVKLEIRNPKSETELLSTENGKIKVNPECQLKEYVEKADYEATYQVGGIGGYEMTLTAESKNGTYTINDSFEVRDQVAFDIERVIATRLYPPVTYPAVFNITANEDFEGLVKEVVPASFAITQLEGAKAFDVIEDISEASASAQPLEAAIFNLVPPFDIAHPITTRFGQELNDPVLKVKYSNYGLLGHDGVDFDMEEGTPVLAVDDGVVVRARENWDYGTTIVIEHSWGKSYYGHLSLMTKKEGDKVQKGYPIGLSGSTGLSTGPHLHFGIKPNSNDPSNGYYGKIDPLPYLALKEGNQDVLGENSENSIIQLPASSSSTLRMISWNLSLKKGETLQLGYNFQVPNISPQFYLIGPLKFESNDRLIFQEARLWQIAVDAVLPTPLIPGAGSTPNGGDADTATSNKVDNEAAALCSTTNCSASVDETIALTDNGTKFLANTSQTDAVQGFELTDMPSDFSSMDNTLTIDVRVQTSGTRTDDNITLLAQVFENGGTAALTNQITICTFGATNTCGTTWNTISASSFTLQGNNTKAVWDSAELHLTWDRTQSASPDAIEVQVSTAELDGTYTATSGPTNDQLMRHGAWFDSGVEQPFTF